MAAPRGGRAAPPVRWRLALLVLVVGYAGVYSAMLAIRVGTDTWWFENAAFLPLYVLAGIGALLGASRQGLAPRQRLGWRSIGMGWVFSCFGAWAYLLPQTPAVTLAGDLLYKAYYPLLIVGFLLLADAEARRDHPVRALLELAIVAVAALTLSWYFVWGPLGGATSLVSGISDDDVVALGEAAVLMAAGVALIAPARCNATRALEILGAGALLGSMGDLMLASATVDESIPLRQLGAIVLAVSATLVALSGLLEPRERPAGVSMTASLLPYVAISAIGLLLLREAARGGGSGRALGGLLVGAVLLTALVLARVILAEREARGRAVQLVHETEVRLELERQLRSREKLEALGLLAGGVAHDINNILQVVRGNADLARSDPSGNVEIELREIVTATERGAALCRQLLLFGRPQLGERTDLVVSTMLRDFLPMLRRVVPTSIAIELVDEAPAATIHADRSQVEVAILNLVMNARAAIAAEGRITLELRTVPPATGQGAATVQLMVRDSGCGMSASTLARAVEPFFTTKGRDGSGLGLSTVLGTMRSLGGEMTLRSTEGGGTEVTLSFPAVEGGTGRTAAAGSPAPRPSASTRVMVVDDEPAVRKAVQRNLALRGYVVTTAADGQEALDLLERTGMAVDAVVSDINMPRVNGITLAQRLRERGATFPIVLMTGYAGPELERNELPAGTALLGKPFDFDELSQLLARMLGSAP